MLKSAVCNSDGSDTSSPGWYFSATIGCADELNALYSTSGHLTRDSQKFSPTTMGVTHNRLRASNHSLGERVPMTSRDEMFTSTNGRL